MRVQFRDVSYRVRERWIVRDINIDVAEGLNVIIGPNGAGKTTLLRLVAGIILPTKGEVLIDGAPPSRARRHVAYMPAQLSLDPLATVDDVAEAMSYDSLDGSWKQSFRRWLEVLGMGWASGRPLMSLSSGEQRLALMAAALSRSPRLLIVDEPLAFLDVRNQMTVMEILRELADEGVTVLAAMHEVLMVRRADKVFILSAGRLVASGQPSEVLDEGLLSVVYGVRFRSYQGPDGEVLLPESTLQLKSFSD